MVFVPSDITFFQQQRQIYNHMNITISKAPGKVLIAGGYGVLEEHNHGLTLGLSNYFYCLCQHHQPKMATNIIVASPQLKNRWQYKIKDDSLYEVEGKENIFVQNALLWTLKFINLVENAGQIKLMILFDRQFISATNIVNQDCSKFPIYSQTYSKTGLGSSACVIVSIVSCLLEILEGKTQQFKNVVNVISQVANLAAQKKIGSNFDISTAVYGSHLYKNILPYKVYDIISQYNSEKYKNLIKIDPEVIRVGQFLKGLRGYIVDINKGANTRKMVSGFLANLKKCEEGIQQQFFKTSKQIVFEFYNSLKSSNLHQLTTINKQHRSLQQKYSKITNVPVEPEDLSPLLDLILGIKGIVYAICPGSGGYDAIFILSEGDCIDRIKQNIDENSVREVKLIAEEEELEVTQEDKEWIQKFMILNNL